MKPLACRYSIVQFVPYTETGEFVNIGVVLTCPQTGYFNFLLQDKKSKRVTNFFDALDRGFYLRTVKSVEEELSRLRATAYQLPSSNQPEALRTMFSALVQPREAIVRFSPARVLLTGDPAQTLRDKFDHYVDHSFATPEYVEQTMNMRLRDLLHGLDLPAPFKPARVGNEIVNARFDFVQTIDSTPLKIIKALNLSQADANDIAAHGDVWKGKIDRLIKLKQLPRDVLINVTLAPIEKSAHHELGQEIIHDLQRHHVTVVPGVDSGAMRQIKEFAQR